MAERKGAFRIRQAVVRGADGKGILDPFTKRRDTRCVHGDIELHEDHAQARKQTRAVRRLDTQFKQLGAEEIMNFLRGDTSVPVAPKRGRRR